MFSISHPEDGTFRLEIHASPSDIDGADARRLRAVLLGLAKELEDGAEDDEPPEATSTARPHRALSTHSPLQQEQAR